MDQSGPDIEQSGLNKIEQIDQIGPNKTEVSSIGQ